jgi:GTPase involved in cell partitioning and DNA repair
VVFRVDLVLGFFFFFLNLNSHNKSQLIILKGGGGGVGIVKFSTKIRHNTSNKPKNRPNT